MTEKVYSCFVFKSPTVPNGLVSFYLTVHIDSPEMPACVCGGGENSQAESHVQREAQRHWRQILEGYHMPSASPDSPWW